jgi:hypothetical protein
MLEALKQGLAGPSTGGQVFFILVVTNFPRNLCTLEGISM